MKSYQTQELVIVFTRYPEPGRTKTRLANILGDQGAADMQRELTEQALSLVRQLQHLRPVAAVVYFAGGSLQLMQDWLGTEINFLEQGEGDLGQRLADACSTAFKQGYRRVVIIGSDCPDLNATLMNQAFTALRSKDIVLGPAADGGYYLIGMNREETSLFTDIPWGSGGVLAATVKTVEKLGLSMEILETLSDVDRPEDLKHFYNNSNA